jgi:hypothetical protein
MLYYIILHTFIMNCTYITSNHIQYVSVGGGPPDPAFPPPTRRPYYTNIIYSYHTTFTLYIHVVLHVHYTFIYCTTYARYIFVPRIHYAHTHTHMYRFRYYTFIMYSHSITLKVHVISQMHYMCAGFGGGPARQLHLGLQPDGRRVAAARPGAKAGHRTGI